MADDKRPKDDDYAQIPFFPPDLFAAVGMLLELSGAYHHIVPGSTVSTGGAADPHLGWPSLTLYIDKGRMGVWRRLAAQWAHSPTLPLDNPSTDSSDMPAEIQEMWTKLWGERKKPVYPPKETGAPAWWISAYGLLVVADEASVDVGYGGTVDKSAAPVTQDRSIVTSMSEVTRPGWLADWVYSSSLRAINQSTSAATTDHVRVTSSNVTITLFVDRDVVCVQPKARTPKVGCTLRTLSHNLSLLPPHGVVRAHWQRLPFEDEKVDNQDLNILLIPIPYRVEASWFASHAPTGAPDDPDWAWFTLQQDWLAGDLREEVHRFTLALMKEATERVGPIHGVVFPEYALDWELHKRIANSILGDSDLKACEFLISGSSKNCLDPTPSGSADTDGNFVLVSQFSNFRKDGQIKREIYTSYRAKHHRWAVDKAQAEAYGFQNAPAFADGKTLWERIGISHREIHVHAFRQSSVFATMICEDLARSDPCHELLRGIGPSIVFVLLMDGPQLQHRWPARYATALADDPGSSVLTFTSLGLIDRANGTASFPASRVFALWKDDTGRTREISLPDDKHGVVISLKGSAADERTLDGRINADTTRWRFSYQQAVRVPSGDEKMVQRVVVGTNRKSAP